jgi:dTDP-4-dehydrorhamnose reductase
VCERDPARAHALNVAGPAWVACCAAAFGGRVLYISTDYVFDGSAPPYHPDSPTHPINAYGRSKRAGELAVLAAGKGMAVLRLPLLFGATDDLSESAVTSALLPPRGNQPVPVDDWATRYPTSTADVAIVCRQMIAAWLAGATLDGIFHWSGKEPHTKYTLCLLLAQLAGLPDDCFRPVLPCPAEVPRPRDCQLDSGALEALGIGARTPLREGLARVLQPHLQWLAPRWAAREGDGRR